MRTEKISLSGEKKGLLILRPVTVIFCLCVNCHFVSFPARGSWDIDEAAELKKKKIINKINFWALTESLLSCISALV